MKLPRFYPLIDIQCTWCTFRAQVKSKNLKPQKKILGAGANIFDASLKIGHMIPPLITNNKWIENGVQRQEIRFYPFLYKKNIKKRTLSATAKRANYPMFDYIGLDELHFDVLFTK